MGSGFHVSFDFKASFQASIVFFNCTSSYPVLPCDSRIYVDTPLHHLLDLKIKKSFFERGGFPPVVQNASDSLVLENPWVNGTMVAPFDQRENVFYSAGVVDCDLFFQQPSISF